MEGKPLSPPRHQAVRPRPRPPDACVPNPLSSTVASIQFDRDRLPCLTPRDLASNIWSCYDLFDGGQARVYLCAWQNPPGAAQPSVIPDNRRVAIKHCLLPHGGGRFPAITTEWKFRKAGEDGEECLDRELEVLQRLHDSGCGERVVCPLAQTRWDGKWFDDPAERACRWWMPTYAYVMPAYRLGSVRSLLDDICNRRAPEAAQRHFLSMPFIAGEMATLLGELRKIHDPENGEGLMIQDLTPGNLLVDDEYVGGGGMRLLLADPGMAAKIELLKRSTDRPRRHVTGTWLWGCMAARSGSFDEGADLYSLSAVGVEMWLVAEGALATAEQTVLMLHLDQDPGMPHAVQFLRHLVLETVKTHHREGKLNPRVTRNLPVSWLGAWALLLGCRDHKTEADMASGRPHLRPSEAEMLPVYQQWARVAAAAAALPPDLTSEQAAAPGCAALVADMCGLFEQLKRLSRLEQGGELEDVPTRWLAANFMVQEHPLVAAMRAQGAASGAQPDDKYVEELPWRVCRDGWCEAVQRARRAAVPASPAHNGVGCASRQSPQKRKLSEDDAPMAPEHVRQQQQRQQSALHAPVALETHAAVRQQPQAPDAEPAAAPADAAAADVARGVSSLSLQAPYAYAPGAAGNGIAWPPSGSGDLLGSPSKRARSAQQRPAFPASPSSAATAAAAMAGGAGPGGSSWAAAPGADSGSWAPPFGAGGGWATAPRAADGSQAAPQAGDGSWTAMPGTGGGWAAAPGALVPAPAAFGMPAAGPASDIPLLAGLANPQGAITANGMLGSSGSATQLFGAAALPGWSSGATAGGSRGFPCSSRSPGLQQHQDQGAVAAAAAAAAGWGQAGPATASSPAMLPLPYASQLGGSGGTGARSALPPSGMALQPQPQLQTGPQPSDQPAAAQTAVLPPLSQLGEQFAPFAYPPGMVFDRLWGKEEQAYAAQIVAAFTARCPGLKDRALYIGCQSGALPGYNGQQVQETRSARNQLTATFERCFAARLQARRCDSKAITDKMLRMLGHRNAAKC